MENAKWWWFDKIRQTSKYIKELKDYELEELSLMIEFEREKIRRQVNGLKFINPDREDSISSANFPDWAKLDLLEERLNAELDRRAGRVAVVGSKKQPKKQPFLALFYRTLQNLDIYHIDGTLQEHYKTVGERHGVSAGAFKSASIKCRPLSDIAKLADALGFDMLEELAAKLPDPDRLLDTIRVEKARRLKK